MRRLLRPLLLLAAAPALMGAECEEPLVKDSGFDVWCGDTLCNWQLDEGTIAKVPSWHGQDFGVALQGDATQISQRLTLSNDDVACLHFNLLADVDRTDPVNVVLELDFDDDGLVEHTETIPSGAWIPLSYHITAPTYYRGVRISLRKSGAGHAALAQIQASKSSECTGPPLATANRPEGATCESADACATGRCLSRALNESLLPDTTDTPKLCEGCGADADCAPGGACGIAFRAGFAVPFRGCVAGGARQLGERCIAGAECATGVCCRGVCSTCCPDGGPGCDTGDPGAVCSERARDAQGRAVRMAWQCAPGGRRGVTGAPCLGDDDCAGGSCAGAAVPLSVCATDGRRCAVAADCPPSIFDNSCIALGVAGGRCL